MIDTNACSHVSYSRATAGDLRQINRCLPRRCRGDRCNDARIRRFAAIAIFLLAAIGTYALLNVLVLIATFASGGGISCENTCTGVQQFFDDVWPYSLVVFIATSASVAFVITRRMVPRKR